MTEQQEVLREIIQKGKSIPLDILKNIHAVDIANILEEEEASDEQIYALYQSDDLELLADILTESCQKLQAKIINLLEYEEVIKLFSFMPKDDITDIMGALPIILYKRLLNLMKVEDSHALKILLGYDKKTAGGIMTTEYIALYEELTISRSLEKIKQIAPKTEVIENIFVLSRSGELKGIADLRDILVESDDKILKDIMETHFISVKPEEDQEDVSRKMNKYSLFVIPVTNRRGALLGIITADDIMNVMIEEQTEDILKLGGVSEEEEIGGPILKSVTRRLPWLIVNLFTAFIAASAISIFDSVIAQVAALASMMTMVSGMGGNAGSQSLSLTIRSLTLGEVNLKEDWKLVFREMLIGLIDGAAIGILTAVVMSWRYGNPYLGFIILLAMICNLILAGTAGFLIPLLIKRMGGDPALASSIFLTTVTDTGGFFIFLGLASILLHLL